MQLCLVVADHAKNNRELLNYRGQLQTYNRKCCQIVPTYVQITSNSNKYLQSAMKWLQYSSRWQQLGPHSNTYCRIAANSEILALNKMDQKHIFPRKILVQEERKVIFLYTNQLVFLGNRKIFLLNKKDRVPMQDCFFSRERTIYVLYRNRCTSCKGKMWLLTISLNSANMYIYIYIYMFPITHKSAPHKGHFKWLRGVWWMIDFLVCARSAQISSVSRNYLALASVESQPRSSPSQVLAALMAPSDLSCHFVTSKSLVWSLNLPCNLLEPI